MIGWRWRSTKREAEEAVEMKKARLEVSVLGRAVKSGAAEDGKVSRLGGGLTGETGGLQHDFKD